jgi:hypothetical protein
MATATIKDLRRNDQRDNTLANPFWITSSEITPECDDKGAVLFSFPNANERFIIHNAITEVITAFAGGTPALVVGSGTLATDAVTTGGDVTIVDADDYFAAADITEGTIGIYPAIASDLGVAILANTMPATARVITGAATTVPCVYASLTSTDTLTAGKARVHLLVSRVP